MTRGKSLGAAQVLASLIVSVLLVGFKLNSAKDIVQTIERRQELKVNLSMVRRLLEIEDTEAWIKDVEFDTKQREDRIAELESASGQVYELLEDALIAKGPSMFAIFEASSAGAKKLKHSALIMYSETKLDEATGLLFGRAAVMVRATPKEIVAHSLVSDDGHFVQSTADPTVFVRSDVVEHANAHHTIVFSRCKVTGISDRTFLNSIVAKTVEEDPSSYMIVALPIAQHDKITRKDEKGAVRAENCRAFKLTEVVAGITKLEYACSLNLRGSIPQAITNNLSVPAQMNGAPPPSAPARLHTIFAARDDCARIDSCSDNLRSDAVPTTLQRYFQQIRPIAKCDAADGRVVGHMLHDLFSSKPKDLPRAIREFVHRTAMLRECGLAHIGDMLARLLSADVQGKSYDGTSAIPTAPVPTTAVGLDPSSLTEEQAIAIGAAIVLSVREADMPATGLKRVVESHAVLLAMKSKHAWFAPMLETIMAHKAAEPRASMWMKRLSSRLTSVAPRDAASNADGADEESGFSSVVRLGA